VGPLLGWSSLGLVFLGLHLLGHPQESVLLLLGLEATMSVLGAGVDELERNLLRNASRGLFQQRLAEGQHTLLGSNDAALDHDPVLVHNTVMGEPTNRCDGLDCQIKFCGRMLL